MQQRIADVVEDEPPRVRLLAAVAAEWLPGREGRIAVEAGGHRRKVPLRVFPDNRETPMPTVSALHVYPVKSLGGYELAEAQCTSRGLRHDRRFMVVDPGGNFLTQREHPRMATAWTDVAAGRLRLAAPDAGEVELDAEPLDGEKLRVTVWNSTVGAVAPSREADAWLSAFLEAPCRLVYMPESTERLSNAKFGHGLVGFADGFAHLVVGEASLADLNARLGKKGHAPLPMNRFRPNIVLAGTAPYAEDALGEFRVGEAILRGTKPCGRCQITTTDQATGDVRGPEPLATLSEYRDDPKIGTLFGMNCATVKPGVIRVGDALSA